MISEQRIIELAIKNGGNRLFNKDKDDYALMGNEALIAFANDLTTELMKSLGKPIGIVTNRYGDPVAFAARGLEINNNLQSKDIGCLIYALPNEKVK